MKPLLSRLTLIGGIALAALAGSLAAQTTPAESGEKPLVLSAFTVSTTQDQGYRAGNSVSATRIDTPIKNLPFSTSRSSSSRIPVPATCRTS